MQLQIVKYSKGQMKIQEMAFVLVAILIFFALAALFYFAIRFSNLKEGVQELRDLEANEIIKKLSATPEFSWSGCANCIDMDKVLFVKENEAYREFWNLDYMKIERVYPTFEEVECTTANYPNCNSVTFVSKQNYGTPSWTFVALCRNAPEKGGYQKCELGKLYASGVKVE